MPKVTRLKELREKRMLSQRDLAEKAGMSPTTIIQIEAGRAEAQFRTVRKLAEALGVEAEELVEPDPA